MYNKYKDIPSRYRYQVDLQETIDFFNALTDSSQQNMKSHILRQLNDIKEHINEFEQECDVDEINERYDLGAIAVNALEDDSEAQLRLIDIFWGVLHYSELK